MRWEIALPTTVALIYRSHTHNSLTTPGILLATLTATAHALHPSPVPFTLLITFFLLGTAATRIKKDIKATLTLSSTGSHARVPSSSGIADVFSGGWNKTSEYNERKVKASEKSGTTAGGQEPRSAVQVLANSGWSSALCLLHVYLSGTADISIVSTRQRNGCFGGIPSRDLLLAGIIANYAAVTADTLSSELGILSSVKPRFILNFREVPPGTNGGVTGAGLFAGLAGALGIGAVSGLFLHPMCPLEGNRMSVNFSLADTFGLVLAVGAWGALGSALDSVLGALFQASVVDRRSGKVVEAPNGGRVLFVAKKEKVQEDEKSEGKPSRALGAGRDILDNNQVNFLMAGAMTVGGIVSASMAWDVPLSSIWGKW